MNSKTYRSFTNEFWLLKKRRKTNSEVHSRYDIVEEDIKFDTEEILDVKWIDIEAIKNMKKEELRGYDISIQFIKDFEENKIYPLEIFNNTIYDI